VFAVIDNSGWLAAINNPKLTQEEPTPAGDVYFQMEVTTYYKDNDIYNDIYYGFLIIAGVIVFVLLSFLIALKCLRNKYNRLMEQKAEYK
jgi:hypothetical protein